uniref:Uncharacterized protein n=1 Tax=Oryza sativa subsp. japonica TaxID=39947 RepID=Q6ZAD6_ORYSJ|nr:hypothetical protein [Oryza sativa Japonica Group]
MVRTAAGGQARGGRWIRAGRCRRWKNVRWPAEWSGAASAVDERAAGGAAASGDCTAAGGVERRQWRAIARRLAEWRREKVGRIRLRQRERGKRRPPLSPAVTTGNNPTGIPYVRALFLIPGGKALDGRHELDTKAFIFQELLF